MNTKRYWVCSFGRDNMRMMASCANTKAQAVREIKAMCRDLSVSMDDWAKGSKWTPYKVTFVEGWPELTEKEQA